MPTDMTQRTAVASAIWSQTLSTGAAGALGAYLFPWAPTGASVVYGAGPAVATPVFLQVATDLTVSTGVATGGVTSLAGPLNANLSSIQAYRLNSASIRITTIPSLNNSSGQVQIGYFTDYPNDSFVTVQAYSFPTIPQALVSSMTNYEIMNMKSLDLRLTTVIDGPADLTMTEIAGGASTIVLPQNLKSEGWYILVTGAPIGTPILTITVAYSYEYLPTVSSLPLLNVMYSSPGSATIPFISTIIKAYPQLLKLSLPSARRLASLILTSGIVNYNQLMDYLRTVMTNYRPRQSNTDSFVLAAGGEGL